MVPRLTGLETTVVVTELGIGNWAFGWNLVAAVPPPGEVGEQVADTEMAAEEGWLRCLLFLIA